MVKTGYLKPVLIFLATLVACHPILDADHAKLKKKADEINAIFVKARSEIEALKLESRLSPKACLNIDKELSL